MMEPLKRYGSRRGQSGSSLLLVLALISVLSVLIPALLTLTGTGLRITQPVVRDRAEVYAATSAIEAAIANARVDTSVGFQGAPCKDRTLDISGFEVDVSCQTYPVSDEGCRYLDRFATFFAEVREPGNSEVLFASSAEVAFRFSLTGPTKVEVRKFASDTDGPVTTQPLPSCHGTPTSTTTTSTSTSTTTTTTLPTSTTTTSTTTSTIPSIGQLVAVFSNPTKEVPPTTSKNRWRALASVQVKNTSGAPVGGADVQVQVRYRKNGDKANTWRNDTTLTGTTDANGLTRFTSPEYPTNGQKVIEIQFAIISVSRTGYSWVAPNPETTTKLEY